MKALPFIVSRSLFQLSQSIVLALALLSGEAHAQSHSSSGKASQQAALQKGQAALRKGDLPEARADLEKAVHLAPNDAAAQSALGWVLALQGENEAAVVHLRTALKIRPDLVEAQLTLASVLSKQGNLAE
ncbi:MAG TPA: tetratricopeptide repeat protein, partial [Candidatus Sulfotelmatobacter sp.]|nr:tetratricopeptide repeat protein [Candidatus Sulfotelmatobacter sp.]